MDKVKTLQAFLSIQAQDFIEEEMPSRSTSVASKFLSIQAQDFIEEGKLVAFSVPSEERFLSIQAQDFIEERASLLAVQEEIAIPEHSSSGLH